MRALATFLAAIFGSLLLAALLAWPSWLATQALVPEWHFHRVVGRLWQLLLLAGLLLALRHLGIRGRDDWGYGLARPVFLRQAGAGFAIGLATMLPMTLAMAALGILELRPEFSGAFLAQSILAGLAAGLGVAVVEESFFRGVMYRAIERESGFALAAWGTTLVYASIHLFARSKIPAAEVTTDSGLRLLAESFEHFVNPLPVLGSFLTLVFVGLLLAFVRRRTGAIAAPIGLHMGWVAVMKATIVTTRVDEDAAASFLVAPFDGYTGWLVAAWAALLFGVAWANGWLRKPAPSTP
jgi:membrane protease YdiL (CAAX protease family)